jgi:hypothetical protein
MVYNPYEDENLLKNQGGVSRDSLVAKGAEGLGRAVIDLPKPFVAASRTMASMTGGDITQGIANRLSADAKTQNEALNRGNVNLALGADKLKTDIASGNFPRRLNELPNSPVSPIGNLSRLPEKNLNQDRVLPGMGPLLATNPNVDKRFQDMQAGIRGVSQAQVRDAQSRGLQYGGNQDGLKAYPKLNQIPTFTNDRGMLQARDQNGNLMSRQAGIDAARQNNLNNLGQVGKSVLASRQPEQSVRYSNGGLDITFAPGTSNQEITDFTGTHRGLVNARQEQEKINAAQATKLQAMNDGRGPGPAMPTLPNLSGMTVNRQEAAIKAYTAKQSAYDNWHQNVTQAENYRGQNANAAEQNAISREHYGVTGANDALRAQTDATTKTQEMNLANSKDINTQRALMNATPEQSQAYHLGLKAQEPDIKTLRVPINPDIPALGEQDILVNATTGKQINYSQDNKMTFEQALASHPAYQKKFATMTAEQQDEMRKRFAGGK